MYDLLLAMKPLFYFLLQLVPNNRCLEQHMFGDNSQHFKKALGYTYFKLLIIFIHEHLIASKNKTNGKYFYRNSDSKLGNKVLRVAP